MAMRTRAIGAAGDVCAGVPFPTFSGSFYKQQGVDISINPTLLPGGRRGNMAGPVRL